MRILIIGAGGQGQVVADIFLLVHENVKFRTTVVGVPCRLL